MHWLKKLLSWTVHAGVLGAVGLILPTAALPRPDPASSYGLASSIAPIYDYDPAVEPGKFAREVDTVAAPDGALYAAFITDAPADDQQCQQSVRVFRSTDAGRTWQDDGLPPPDPPAPPCDQPREGCRYDQLMDPILAMGADGYPRLGMIWIHGCGSTTARSVRSASGWSKPQSLLPIDPNAGPAADGSYTLATADGNEYYGWSSGLPLAFGGEIALCPAGDCAAPVTATLSSRVEFGGLKMYAHPAGGAAVVWSKSIGVRTMLLYRHLLPSGAWATADDIPITDPYPTSIVAIGLRAFSLAFVPGQPQEAIVAYIVNAGSPSGGRASYLVYRRTTDAGATWSGPQFIDGSQGTTGSGQPQYEIVQFPALAANSGAGRVGLLYQMRDTHQDPSLVHTYLRECENGTFGEQRLTLSGEQPSLYSSSTGAWRFGEYNGLAAIADPCYLGAWQSIADVGGVQQGRILTRRVCLGSDLPPFRSYLPFAPFRAQLAYQGYLPYVPMGTTP